MICLLLPGTVVDNEKAMCTYFEAVVVILTTNFTTCKIMAILHGIDRGKN